MSTVALSPVAKNGVGLPTLPPALKALIAHPEHLISERTSRQQIPIPEPRPLTSCEHTSCSPSLVCEPNSRERTCGSLIGKLHKGLVLARDVEKLDDGGEAERGRGKDNSSALRGAACDAGRRGVEERNSGLRKRKRISGRKRSRK